MTTENAVAKTREPQIAIVPLDEIQIEDVGRDVSAIDAWLQDASGGVVTLDRIQNVAGLIPVVGNAMALADAISDIVTLVRTEGKELLDWVSLGINLVCIIPFPGSTVARMSLRPILFLVRRELANVGKMLLGDALIEIVVGHLNATIVGKLEHFLTTAQSQLPGLLEQAGQLGEAFVLDLAKGMRALVDGDMDVKGRLVSAQKNITSINTEQLKRDPLRIITNVYSALRDLQVAAGKGMANSAAKLLMPDQAKKRVYEQTERLITMGPELRVQLRKLNDPALKGSIGSLVVMLNKAVQLWHVRNPRALSSSIKKGTTSKAQYIQGKGQLEVRKNEVPPKKKANEEKNGTCVGTCNSINFAMGSESLEHTDFSLPGPFPIEWTRTYFSALSAYDQDVMGARWVTEFTTRFDCIGDALTFHDADGRSHDYPLPKERLFHFDAIENLTVVRLDQNRLMLCRGFDRKETYVRHGDRFLLAHIELR
ncbi:DUF6531 domain-containing protein, partial [Pseudomonas sp. TAD18]